MIEESVQFSRGPETIAAAFFAPEGSSAPKPCLVICHGAFEYKENFFPLAAFLAEGGVGALVPDMPGHGQSSGDRYHINIGLWVRAISRAVDWLAERPEIDGRRIGAFGFSSGGTAVLEAALVDSRIKALITLDATVRNYLGVWDTLVFKLLNGAGRLKKKLTGRDLRLNILKALQNTRVAHDPAVNAAVISDPSLVAAYRAFPLPGAAPTAFVDTLSRLDKISAPTLILHGAEDRVDPPETARLILDALTCEKHLEFLPESGHCGHLDTHKNQMMQRTKDWAVRHL